MTLFLQISVDPRYFNRVDMLALARALRDKYGHLEPGGLNVAICDDYETAKSDELIHMTLTRQTPISFRGAMDTNPVGIKPGIQFSTERGHPWTEVSLDLDD